MTLKLLTLNLWHDSGPYAERQRLIREWIDRLDPDLIGFQEALRKGEYDQTAELLDGRGYHIDFSHASGFWKDASYEFGNAVASRWPILSREEKSLPDLGDDETRSAIAITIDAPFGQVSLTCTHLHWQLHHGWVRERQVVALCDFAIARRPAGGFPVIMMGDFNAVPESDEIRYVTGLHSIGGRSVHFRDAWEFAGEGGHGATWSRRNDYARKALEPDRRLDYIFVGPPRENSLGQIECCRIVCNEEINGAWPSDHFGLYAELRTEPLTN